jgi:hypothetical protein
MINTNTIAFNTSDLKDCGFCPTRKVDVKSYNEIYIENEVGHTTRYSSNVTALADLLYTNIPQTGEMILSPGTFYQFNPFLDRGTLFSGASSSDMSRVDNILITFIPIQEYFTAIGQPNLDYTPFVNEFRINRYYAGSYPGLGGATINPPSIVTTNPFMIDGYSETPDSWFIPEIDFVTNGFQFKSVSTSKYVAVVEKKLAESKKSS